MLIRKQDYKLTLDDLSKYPAWEYALNEESVRGQNERTVRPFLESPPLDPRESYIIVRASFIMANGTMLKGYLSPLKVGEPSIMEHLIPYDLSPVILTERGRVVFGYGYKKPDIETIAQNYSILGHSPTDAFPIRFGADIDIVNGIAEGILEGFLYFDSTEEVVNLSENDQKYIR